MILRPTNPVKKNWGTVRGKRMGVLLHYDASGSDAGALAWLTRSPDCAVSYNVLITDDGYAHEIAPLTTRAWHAGVCQSSDAKRLPYVDANSALYGVSIAATDGEVATPAQFGTVVEVCRMLATMNGWDLQRQPWRIVGHDTEAWPRGRKLDPTGSNPKRPVLSTAAVRAAFDPDCSPCPDKAA